MTKETIEQFKKLSEHDQKEVLNLIRLKNKFKKQEIERKAKAYDELIDYLKNKIKNLKNDLKGTKGQERYFLKQILNVYEEILNKIEKR